MCVCVSFFSLPFKWRFIRSLSLWHNSYNASIKMCCSYTRCAVTSYWIKNCPEYDKWTEFEAATAVELHQPPEMEHLFIINNEFLYISIFPSIFLVFMFFFRFFLVLLFLLQNSVTFLSMKFFHLAERITERWTSWQTKNISYYLIQPFHTKYCLTYDNDSLPVFHSRSWICSSAAISKRQQMQLKRYFICF